MNFLDKYICDFFINIVKEQFPEVDPWDIMMVGDRLETDISLANQVCEMNDMIRSRMG